MKAKIFWALPVAILGGVAALGLPHLRAHSTAGVEVIPDVEIGRVGGRVFHVEIARPMHPPSEPMPAVLYIHGGGGMRGSYQNGSKGFLATKGYFTASVDYRLIPEAKWPAQLEDCKLAVRWLRANAEKYHVDPNRIGCWGASAGGHLAACLGVTGAESSFDGSGGYPGVSSAVQAVVDQSGPVDFTDSAVQEASLHNAKSLVTLDLLFGDSYSAKPDLWKDGSPITHVRAGAPPFLVVHGDQDLTVPYNQSVRFVAALKGAGVPVQFVTFPGCDHHLKMVSAVKPDAPAPRPLDDLVLEFFDANLKGKK